MARAGNTTYHRQADGQYTESRYDAANRTTYSFSHAQGDDGKWSDTHANMFYDAAGNLGVTRISSSDYGFDEVTTQDVRYDAQHKTVQNAWVRKARGLRGTTTFTYDVNGQLTLLDRGRQQKARENTVASFAYDNEGHILARADAPSLTASPRLLAGYHVDPAIAYAADAWGAASTLADVVRQALFQTDADGAIALTGYLYANGHPVAETRLDQQLALVTVALDPTQSRAVYDDPWGSDPAVIDHTITLESADIVTVDGVLDRAATARAIAARVYQGFGTLSAGGQAQLAAYIEGRLAALSDAEVVAGAPLSVWGYLHLADGPTTNQQTVIDYAVANIGGADGLPGSAVIAHTVRAGETLQALAAAYYGAPAYWYLLAEANGLTGNEELKAGTRLTVPNTVANSVSDKDTYKVYHESEIIGATSPEIQVKQKKKKWYQKLVQILIVVIVVVAAVITAGAALAAMGVTTTALGTLGAVGASLAGTVGLAGLGGLAGLAAAGLMGYAIGYATSFATQGLAILAGLQEKFDWKAARAMGGNFAVSGLAAAAGGWVTQVSGWGAGTQMLAQAGIQAGAQLARDGRVSSVAGVLLALLPAAAKLPEGHWLRDTAQAVNDIGANTASAGLAVLEASIRGDDMATGWANLAAAVLNGPAPADGQFRYHAGAGLDWNAIARETLIGAGLSLIVGDRFGEDAALEFFGAALGTTVAGVLAERERYAPIGEAIRGNAPLEGLFDAINHDPSLTAEQRAGLFKGLQAVGEASQAQARLQAAAEAESRAALRAQLALPVERDEFGRSIESEEAALLARRGNGVYFHRTPEAGLGDGAGASDFAAMEAEAQAKDTYTIKKGDTLWALAKKTGLSVDYLARVNGIENPNLILEGNTLTGFTDEQLAMLRGGAPIVPIVSESSDRKQSIIKDTPARFLVNDNVSADSSQPFYEAVEVGRREVAKYEAFIDEASKKYNVDKDLVKAVMFMETSHGQYDVILSIVDKNKTILPMNVHSEYWKDLGYTRDQLKDPRTNIDAGTLLLSRISERVEAPTIAKIASVYNFVGAEKVTDYGARVQAIYDQRLWEEPRNTRQYDYNTIPWPMP